MFLELVGAKAPLYLYLRTSLELLPSAPPYTAQRHGQMGRMGAPFQERLNSSAYCFLETFSYTCGQEAML